MSGETAELAILAKRIRASHRKSRDEIVQCGGWLIQAKDICLRHGPPWLTWLETEANMPARTANWYMQKVREIRTSESRIGNIADSGQEDCQKSVFHLATEIMALMDWLRAKRDSWPEEYRDRFIPAVRQHLDGMEVRDDAKRRGRGCASQTD